MPEPILALDFDGVLHPAEDAVFVDFSRPAWELSMQLRAQGRFAWMEHLVEVLQDSDVRVLVHSTWRRRLSDRDIREIVGPEIGDRMILMDQWIEPPRRRELSHAGYIHESLTILREEQGMEPSALCVLDDRPELFAHDASLLSAWRPMHIWTHGATGIQDSMVQRLLSGWVAAHGRSESICERSECAPAG